MTSRPLLIAAAFLCAAAMPLQPRPLGGTIRVWGHPAVGDELERLAKAFVREQPNVKFEFTLRGSDTAIPGLYSGRADIAFLARENNLVDDNGFGRVKQYQPLRLEVMNGSLGRPGEAHALAILVHKDNPVNGITLGQLDALFGCERRRGHAPVAAWGDLGLGGEWKDKPISLHMHDARTNTGIFFQRIVAMNSRKMRWAHIAEYGNSRHADGTALPAAERVADAAREDRYALAVSSLAYANPDLKVIPVAEDQSGPYVFPSRATVIARTYPLARRVYAFIDPRPTTGMKPETIEFLRFVLSASGQALVDRGGFLPLSEASMKEQRQILEAAVR